MCDHQSIHRLTEPGVLPQVATCRACNRTLRRESFDVPWKHWGMELFSLRRPKKSPVSYEVKR